MGGRMKSESTNAPKGIKNDGPCKERSPNSDPYPCLEESNFKDTIY